MEADDTQPRFEIMPVAIIVLALATALIHIYLAVPDTVVAFYLNGAGYIALLIALYWKRLARWQRLARIGLIGYTLLTIVLWVLIGEQTQIAYLDKSIEVLLVLALLWEWRTAMQTASTQDSVQ